MGKTRENNGANFEAGADFTGLKRGKIYKNNRKEEEGFRTLRYRIFTTQNIPMAVLSRAWKWLECEPDNWQASGFLAMNSWIYSAVLPYKPSQRGQKRRYISFLVTTVFSVCTIWNLYSRRCTWRHMDCPVISHGRNWSEGLRVRVYSTGMAVGIRCNNR